MRGAGVARVARSPPAAAVCRASVRAICAATETCVGTPSTMIVAGKTIDHEASREPSIKPRSFDGRLARASSDALAIGARPQRRQLQPRRQRPRGLACVLVGEWDGV
jgi:hypothetical protein